MEIAAPATEVPRRSDGEASRERLLHTALRLFAAHGFEKTSTRLIAAEAGANIGAIAYYFGDKAGLYRAAFTEPMGSPSKDIAHFSPEHLSLSDALSALYQEFLAPLKMGELAQHCVRLHFREMVEPTGLWQEEVENGITPYHHALVAVLCRHLGVSPSHLSPQRLAVSIVAQGVFSFVGRDCLSVTAPHLFATPDAVDGMAEHFARCALAMVAAEKERISNETT